MFFMCGRAFAELRSTLGEDSILFGLRVNFGRRRGTTVILGVGPVCAVVGLRPPDVLEPAPRVVRKAA